MRILLLALAAPLLMSAASPLAEAELAAAKALAEQRRLETLASQSRNTAAEAAALSAAAAAALIAAEERINASEAQLAALGSRREFAERRLIEARRPVTALMAGLAQLDRRPQWIALAGATLPAEQVRLAVLVRHLRPVIEQRTVALRGELEALRTIDAQRQQALAALRQQRSDAIEARQRFADAERAALVTADRRGLAAFAAEDRVVDRTERAASLRTAGERQRAAARLAATLAMLPPAQPRPSPAESARESSPFSWRVPAGGAITVGLGELLSNGVRARGLTIAAARGTEVVAPAAGRIVFAGPFRRRAGIVIIDHGGGWATLISEVRPGLKVGEQVDAGAPVGRALGAVTAELFRGGTAEPAALIARSS